MPNSPLLDAKTIRWLPWVVAIAFFMQSLDGTILNTALPAMANDLNEDPLCMQSVIIAYMLTVALLIPASGWIADRFGTKNIFPQKKLKKFWFVCIGLFLDLFGTPKFFA